MPIEDTKFIVEVTGGDEVNAYLRIGWSLINQYIIDVGELGQPSQRPRYVLAWQGKESELQHPQNSSYLTMQREADRLRSRIRYITPGDTKASDLD